MIRVLGRRVRSLLAVAVLLVGVEGTAPGAEPASQGAPPGRVSPANARVRELPSDPGTLSLLYAPEFRPADLLHADLLRLGPGAAVVAQVSPLVTELRGDVPPGPPAPPGRPDLFWPAWPSRPFETSLPLEEGFRRADAWRGSQNVLQPARVGTRLLLRGPTDAVRLLEQALLRLDRPAPQVGVLLVVAEVRCASRCESGGRLLFSRDAAPGGADGAFRSIDGTFEPDAWIRSRATGLLPFQGTSVTFGRFFPLDGVFEHVLRALAVRQEAELVARPYLVCTEGAPCGVEVLNAIPNLRLTAGVPRPLIEAAPPLDTGLRLGLRALRVQPDGATLDLHVQLRSAEPSLEPDAIPGALVHRSRDLTTRATVRDGQSLLLGGVTLTRRLRHRRAFPWLGTVAPLDLATSGRGLSVERTELIVVLVPRILACGPEAPVTGTRP